MRDFKKVVEDNYDYLVKTRRHFHQNPELSCQEIETVKYITAELDRFGIEYQKIGETSVVASISGKPGKVVAIRGDIDALPITEKTGVVYASTKDGVMHACGHDFHTTFMLGTAKLLQEIKDELNGTVKVIFQEGEEIGAGAKKILDSGILDDVQNIAGLHVAVDQDLGTFTTGYGVRSSIGGGMIIDIEGKAGHSSTPHLAINPIEVATRIISAVSQYCAYSMNAQDNFVFVPTILKSGNRGNIIPGEAQLQYNLRAFDEELANKLIAEVTKLVEEVAHTCGAEVHINTRIGMGSVVNEKKSTDLSMEVIKSCFGEDAVKITRPSMGGEDFSYYQKRIPGTFAFIGAAKEGEYGKLHTETTLPLEEILKYGVEFFLTYVFAYFESDF